MNHNRVLIALSTSTLYAPYMSVTIQSVVEHCSPRVNYEIVVLHCELTPEIQYSIKKITEGHPNVKLYFKKVSQKYSKQNYSMRPGYSTESFFRVLLPYFFENEDRILYLDSDTVVNRDVAELYGENVSECFAGVVRDYDGIGCAYNLDSGRAHYMKTVLKMSSCDDYFQSGVMLLNLSAVRERYTAENLLKAACAPEIQWGDQDVLNLLFRGQVKYLNPKWNVVVNDKIVQPMKPLIKYAPKELVDSYLSAREEPYIVHYAATQPWNIPLVDMFPYFWSYAYKSPFYSVIVDRAESRIPINARITNDYYLPQMVLGQFEQGLVGAKYIIRYVRAWLSFKLHKLNLSI